jgi:hypothetical protein
MKFLHLACLPLLLSLAACAGGGLARDDQGAARPGFMPIAASPPPANFCPAVAGNDRLMAQLSGFDSATRDRMAMQSLEQCRSLLAGPRDAGWTSTALAAQ